MATISFVRPLDEALDSPTAPFFGWTLSAFSSTSASFETSTLTLQLTGTGFTLGSPAAGAITGMRLTQKLDGFPSQDITVASGLSVPFNNLMNGFLRQTTETLVDIYDLLFRGDDVVSGSLLGETLYGGPGNDRLDGGAGNDTLVGDSDLDPLRPSNGRDTLIGGAGNDILRGGSGADAMSGGTGSDVYEVENAGDVVTERVGEGAADRVLFKTGNFSTPLTAYVLPANVEAIDVSLPLPDDAFSTDPVPTVGPTISIKGNALANTMAVVNDPALALSDFMPPSPVRFEGLGGNDRLVGGSGNDLLDGGTGVDTMLGGAGNDTYVVDQRGDVVIESLASKLPPGVDLVDYRVAAADTVSLGGTVAGLTVQKTYVNIEGLRLGTATSTLVYNGIGNNAANTLIGNAAANQLYGLGGDDTLDGGGGADRMVGGPGNDTYVVGQADDVIVELAGGGVDLVQSSFSYTLKAEFEKLTLLGTSALNGTGNGVANTINGNAGANVIDGKGGADTMAGGAGNDSYVVDSAGDVVIELAGGGVDIVRSSVSHTLAAEVENLTLTGVLPIAGTGNGLANTLVGNAAANTLDGGAGNDRLTGAGGADVFVLGSTLGSDTITDFAAGVDRVSVSQAAFAIGDGDTTIDAAVSVAGPGGFPVAAEVVAVTANIVGAITAASAAAAIGSAAADYAAGARALFIVDNGVDSALYLFMSASDDAAVSAAELSLLVSLTGTASLTPSDLLFGA
jgi:Ca2+-binding RTX toxin-like protein